MSLFLTISCLFLCSSFSILFLHLCVFFSALFPSIILCVSFSVLFLSISGSFEDAHTVLRSVHCCQLADFKLHNYKVAIKVIKDREKLGDLLLKKRPLKATSRQCSGSVTFWYGTGSWDPYLLPKNPDADPALSVSDQQDNNKNNFFPFSFYACSFSVHLHHSSKIKNHDEVTKQLKSRFSSFFVCWWKDPEPEPDPYKEITDPDPGDPKKQYGSGLGTLLQVQGNKRHLPEKSILRKK